jgi:hypothetical protein
MSNHAEEIFEKTMKSKAILDMMESCETYDRLLAEGWPPDKAFMVAFMGIAVLYIPGMKPIPRPDPPYFSAASLLEAAQQAESAIADYHRKFRAELKSLESFVKKHG